MNKIQKFALTASIMLALALTISCSSDDDKEGDCEKVENAIYACVEEICPDGDDCDDTVVNECIMKKGICEGSETESEFRKCINDYDKKCWDNKGPGNN